MSSGERPACRVSVNQDGARPRQKGPQEREGRTVMIEQPAAIAEAEEHGADPREAGGQLGQPGMQRPGADRQGDVGMPAAVDDGDLGDARSGIGRRQGGAAGQRQAQQQASPLHAPCHAP